MAQIQPMAALNELSRSLDVVEKKSTNASSRITVSVGENLEELALTQQPSKSQLKPLTGRACPGRVYRL